MSEERNVSIFKQQQELMDALDSKVSFRAECVRNLLRSFLSHHKPINLDTLSNSLTKEQFDCIYNAFRQYISSASLQNLDLDLVRLILQFCEVPELLKAKPVCKHFQVALNHPVAWNSASVILDCRNIDELSSIQPISAFRYVKKAIFTCSEDVEFNSAESDILHQCFQIMSHLKTVYIKHGSEETVSC